MSTERFYVELPTISSFLDATLPQNFTAVPDDWYIIITDIVESTKAIESGRYKEVNLIGASAIAALLNVAENLEIPYVFGGDGASMVVPPVLLERAKEALLATSYLAESEFGMKLRVGFVPVSTVHQSGFEIKVAKLRISENYSQSLFTGGGLNLATELIKDPVTADIYNLKNLGGYQGDFSGLECRWQDIPSRHGETVSLMVLAIAHSDAEKSQIYRETLEQIYQIYGNDEDFRPVATQNLKLALESKRLLAETKVRAGSGNWLDKWKYLSQIQIENLLGLFLMSFKIKVGEMNWGQYKQLVIEASDYKKLDEMLRMIIAGNAIQREKLIHYLEQQYKEGKIVYGLHVSDRALMTCLVFERHGRQVHFVDGADGGYALAAKFMKERMKRKADNWKVYVRMAALRHKMNTKSVLG